MSKVSKNIEAAENSALLKKNLPPTSDFDVSDDSSDDEESVKPEITSDFDVSDSSDSSDEEEAVKEVVLPYFPTDLNLSDCSSDSDDEIVESKINTTVISRELEKEPIIEADSSSDSDDSSDEEENDTIVENIQQSSEIVPIMNQSTIMEVKQQESLVIPTINQQCVIVTEENTKQEQSDDSSDDSSSDSDDSSDEEEADKTVVENIQQSAEENNQMTTTQIEEILVEENQDVKQQVIPTIQQRADDLEDVSDSSFSSKGSSGSSSDSDSSDDEQAANSKLMSPPNNKPLKQKSSENLNLSEEKLNVLITTLKDESIVAEKKEKTSTYITTLEEMNKLRLSRHKLETFINLPTFEKTVVGCFVRFNISSKIPQTLDYKIAEIIDVVETPEVYMFGDHVRTNKKLLLRHGAHDRTDSMAFVSNQDFTINEFKDYQHNCKKESVKLPNINRIQQKNERVNKALELLERGIFSPPQLITDKRRSEPIKPKENKGNSSTYITTLDEMNKLRLSRHKLETFINLPIFEKTIVGCFVRVNISPINSKSPQQLGYKMAEIVAVVETPEVYLFGNHIRTNKKIRLRHGNHERTDSMAFVSNQDFTISEFQDFQHNCKVDAVRLPNIIRIAQKKEKVDKALELLKQTSIKRVNQHCISPPQPISRKRAPEPMELPKEKKAKISNTYHQQPRKPSISLAAYRQSRGLQ